MKKTDIINQIFANYLIANILYEEKGSEYWAGAKNQAWHLIFSLDLVDKYSEWEKENEKYYRDSCNCL